MFQYFCRCLPSFPVFHRVEHCPASGAIAGVPPGQRLCLINPRPCVERVCASDMMVRMDGPAETPSPRSDGALGGSCSRTNLDGAAVDEDEHRSCEAPREAVPLWFGTVAFAD